MATSVVNCLEKHISCSVCLEVYTDPHILRCLHTFCYQCIQGVKQGNQVQCPECRQYTDLCEVKKDFKTESLLAINITTSGNSVCVPQKTVCDLCEDSMKPVQSFCINCEELLCANCSKAHTRSKATKDHKFMTFAALQEIKKQKLEEYIKSITDEEKELDSKCTSKKELIKNIEQTEVGQMAEVNRLRLSIIRKINSHHDSLLSEIQSTNQDTITSLEQQGQMFIEARQQLAEKKRFLADISETQNIAVLTDTLKNLSMYLQEELAVIRSTLPIFDRNLKSSVQVISGIRWDPGTSTRIEVADSVAYHMQSPGRGSSSHEVAGAAAVFCHSTN